MAQAKNDAGPGQLPLVAHRGRGTEWLAIVEFEDLLDLIKDLSPLLYYLETPWEHDRSEPA